MKISKLLCGAWPTRPSLVLFQAGLGCLTPFFDMFSKSNLTLQSVAHEYGSVDPCSPPIAGICGCSYPQNMVFNRYHPVFFSKEILSTNLGPGPSHTLSHSQSCPKKLLGLQVFVLVFYFIRRFHGLYAINSGHRPKLLAEAAGAA